MDHAIRNYVNGVILYNILYWTDYLDLKEADLTIDL